MCKTHKFLMITNCDFLSNDIVVLARSAFHVQSWRWRNEWARSAEQASQFSLNSSYPARVEIVAIEQARIAKAPPTSVIEQQSHHVAETLPRSSSSSSSHSDLDLIS